MCAVHGRGPFPLCSGGQDSRRDLRWAMKAQMRCVFGAVLCGIRVCMSFVRFCMLRVCVGDATSKTTDIRVLFFSLPQLKCDVCTAATMVLVAATLAWQNLNLFADRAHIEGNKNRAVAAVSKLLTLQMTALFRAAVFPRSGYETGYA
jgi:hypothetical protein